MTSSAQQAQDRLITRRTYLEALAVFLGADAAMAREVVESLALKRPELGLDEGTDTFAGWGQRALAAQARLASAEPWNAAEVAEAAQAVAARAASESAPAAGGAA